MRIVTELGAPDAATASVEVRHVGMSAPTLVAFAGMGHGLQMPIAEFAGVLAPLAVNVLFVKDLRRCWYQRGIHGLGDTPADAAGALADLVPTGSALAGTIGTSSGGTGAIVFGTLIQAPVALAFSPRTVVDDAAVTRWRIDVPDMPVLDLTAPTADLRRFLSDRTHGTVDVRYGAGNAHDAGQAAHVADLPGVTVTALPTEWHPSAAWLRDRGLLGPTIADVYGLDLLPGQVFADAPPATPPPRRDLRPGPLWRAVRERLRRQPPTR